MNKCCVLGLLIASAAAAQFPVMSYPGGLPAGCTATTGFTVEALCTVPGEIPVGSFTAPAAGTLWTDPNFGGAVRLLADTITHHSYSTISPFSNSGKYVGVKLATTGTSILEYATGKVLDTGRPGNITASGIYWDAVSDDVYYHLTDAKVMKYTISKRKNEVLVDYAVTHGFTQITAGGTGDVTGDNWLAFTAPAQGQLCALDIGNLKTYCATYAAPHPDSRVGWDFLDYPMMSKGVDSGTGKRYVLLVARPALGVFSVNFAAGTLQLEYRGPELRGNGNNICEPGETCLATTHADTFGDSDGRQYLVRSADISSPCSRVVAAHELAKGVLLNRAAAEGGGRHDLMRLNVCGDASLWVSIHVGCAKRAAACVVSTDYPGAARDAADLTTPLRRGPFTSEVFAIRGRGIEVRRLAQTRSVKFITDSYWSYPRAAISPDGAEILFSSNFGKPGQQRSVAVATAFGTIVPAATATAIATTTSVPLADATQPAAQYAVTGLTLINANTGLPVPGFNPIPAGAHINRALLGVPNINIRANTNGVPIGGVSFTLNGAKYTTETVAPYALAGIKNGAYLRWSASAGTYTVVATPFVVVKGGRVPGAAASVTFTLQ
jgi:hypothetical protein